MKDRSMQFGIEKNANNFLGFSIALSALFFLAGCAPTIYAYLEDLKALPNVPVDAAHIYFMRPASTVGGAAWPAILIDDKKRGILPSAAFTIISVSPGEHKISLENEQGSIGGWPSAVKIRLRAGERYFLKLAVASQRTKGITVVPSKIPLILPTEEGRVTSIRWIKLDEEEGIKESRILLYAPVEKSGY